MSVERMDKEFVVIFVVQIQIKLWYKYKYSAIGRITFESVLMRQMNLEPYYTE